MTQDNQTPRAAVLTEADHAAIVELLKCHHSCQFTTEEVLFVRDWLDTAKTAKSELIKWAVKSLIWGIGILAGLQVAVKYGWFKGVGK